MCDDRVKFICKRTVVSTKPVEPGKLYWLSVFDRVMEPNHIRLVCYYRCTKTRKPGETTKKLRESLAETLTCFPMITGRLVKDDGGEWMVKYNDAGVRMIEARAVGTVEEWLKSVDREKELKLVHWEEIYHGSSSYFWSTFYVQITEFEGGGFAIGLSCSHLLADPICATMLLRSWSEVTLAKALMAPPLVHTLPSRRPGNSNPDHKPYNNHLLKHYIDSCAQTSPLGATGSDFTTVALLFMDLTVRAMVQANGLIVSPFEAVAGLLWACVSRAKGMRDKLMGMSLCLDVRKVLHMHQTFFGNCMVYHKVQYKKSLPDTTKDALSCAIDEIRRTVKELDYDIVMDLIEWLRTQDHVDPIINVSDLVCRNLENMVDLRYMKLEEDITLNHMSCYVEGTVVGGGQVTVLPSPSSEGPLSRVVMVTLPRKEMAKVLDDELLQIFSPIVLMGKPNANKYTKIN